MLVLLLLPLFGPEAVAVEIAVTGIRLGEQDYGTGVVLDITAAGAVVAAMVVVGLRFASHRRTSKAREVRDQRIY